VDLSFPIATAYQELIADLVHLFIILSNHQEIDVLTNPQMQHTRELHIVSGELNILKRTLYPLYNMINALREPRGNRHKACYFGGPGGGGTGHMTPNESPAPTTPFEPEKGHGADISSSARVYLADVADHVLILTEEVDMLRGTVENMINLVATHPKLQVVDSADIQHGHSDSE
jgi:Mg2+ and Co2+ transporter CorA